MAPLWGSSYILQLRVPKRIAYRGKPRGLHFCLHHRKPAGRWGSALGVPALGVSPTSSRANPTRPWNPRSPRAGIAEFFEDAYEGGLEDGNVTLLRAWRNRASRVLSLATLRAQGVENFVIQQRVHLAQARNVVELRGSCDADSIISVPVRTMRSIIPVPEFHTVDPRQWDVDATAGSALRARYITPAGW